MKRFVLVVSVLALVLTGCGLLSTDLLKKEGSMIVYISKDGVSPLTITPAIEMVIATYDISGAGPDSETFLETGVTSSPFVKNDLKIGAWTITIDAKNATGDVIASGTGVASITDGQTTTIDITVRPIVGTGTFSFTLEWPTGEIDVPSINATLTAVDGTSTACTFTISGDSASCTETLDNGYYDLTLQLLDDGTVAWGDVYSIRIIAGETTSYTQTLTTTDINPFVSGDLQINIIDDLQNPIDITFAGVDTSLSLNSDMTVTASLDPTITPESWQWYVDGAAISGAAGSSVTVGSVLAEGYHRIAVIIHYGAVSSSHSEWFQVTDIMWSSMNNMPVAKSHFAAGVAVGSKIYTIGGQTDSCDACNTVEEYDPIADTWASVAPMPTARRTAGVGVVNGKIYVFGGEITHNRNFTQNEEYDPVTNTWTSKAPMPTGRAFLTGSVVNGKIYAIGGSPCTSATGCSLTTVEEYDPNTDSWTTKAPMNTTRHFHAAGVVNGRIYVVGGWTITNTMLDSVEEYDPITDQWTVKSPMPTARAGHRVDVVDGYLYAIGGYEASNYGTVERYDPATDTWTTLPEMPTPRHAFATGVVDGYLFAIGGSSATGRTDVVERLFVQ